uniref:Uncharacterized protein n=1 Tax=Anopheles atroparvus TaxID=41427 RepID=A0A182IYS9_ANOAO
MPGRARTGTFGRLPKSEPILPNHNQIGLRKPKYLCGLITNVIIIIIIATISIISIIRVVFGWQHDNNEQVEPSPRHSRFAPSSTLLLLLLLLRLTATSTFICSHHTQRRAEIRRVVYRCPAAASTGRPTQ